MAFSSREIGNPHAKPTRVHHHWQDMEEYQPDGGMWASPTAGDRARHIAASADLMLRTDDFADAMRLALTEWPLSVSVALTTPGLNHRAWLGHAGCYLATGSPEETTRLGWHELDESEQYAANAAATRVISEWRTTYTPPPAVRPEGQF